MASIRKLGKRWRAEIARKGVRKSKVFATRQEAKDWAAHEEFLITGGEKVAATLTLGEVFDRYAREVSPTKRGRRWEQIRLEKLRCDPIARKRLSDVSAAVLAIWRDTRLLSVAPNTVRREMALLSAVFTQCVREWGLLRLNPLATVKKPAPGKPRDRLPTPDEIDRLRAAAGNLSTYTGRAFHAFLFSCETAMRAGEICGLRWEHINGRVAHLPLTKNGASRDVPLSSRALALLDELRGRPKVFDMVPSQLDANWRKLRAKAGVEGLNFHDARAQACVTLSRVLDPFELARVTGHKDLRVLLNTYYRKSAERIADKLG